MRGRYPDDTRRLSYQWFDAHAENPLEQGPVIELIVWVTPNMREDSRLSLELQHGVNELLTHLGTELHPHDHHGKQC